MRVLDDVRDVERRVDLQIIDYFLGQSLRVLLLLVILLSQDLIPSFLSLFPLAFRLTAHSLPLFASLSVFSDLPIFPVFHDSQRFLSLSSSLLSLGNLPLRAVYYSRVLMDERYPLCATNMQRADIHMWCFSSSIYSTFQRWPLLDRSPREIKVLLASVCSMSRPCKLNQCHL